jgi:acetyltransferase-like isoleucine patch superfamily enzyme
MIAALKKLFTKNNNEVGAKDAVNSINSSSVYCDFKQQHDIEVASGVFIDQNSAIQSFTFIGPNTAITKATIGRFCSIAGNVSIGMGEHMVDGISTSSFFYKDAYTLLTKDKCEIGNDVWIGVDSIILRGVSIGDGAIIGANSVVNKDVPPYAIVVGSPARFIRYRFTEEEIKVIKQSAWWMEENIDSAKKKVKELSNQLTRPYYG